MKNEINEFLDQYYASWIAVNKLYERFARENGVNSYGLYILIGLHKEEKGCTQKSISERYGIPKQTINTILQGYLKDDLVAFETLNADKRNKTISLTSKGRAYADETLGKLTRLETEVLLEMGEGKVRGMIEGNGMFIELFRKGLEKEKEKGNFE